MDDTSNAQRPRASLRGKGREILLGEHVDAGTPAETNSPQVPPSQTSEQPGTLDAAALSLTPEEAAALLDFSPDSPVYDAGLAFPVEEPAAPVSPPTEADDQAWLDWMVQPPIPEAEWEQPAVPPPDSVPAWEQLPVEPGSAVAEEALPLIERRPQPVAILPGMPYGDRSALETLNPSAPEQWDVSGAAAELSPAEAAYDYADWGYMPDTQVEPEDYALAWEAGLDYTASDAVPLAEATLRLPVVPPGRTAVEDQALRDNLVAAAPEAWPDTYAGQPAGQDEGEKSVHPPISRSILYQEHEGGLVVPEAALAEQALVPEVQDPFAPVVQRQPSRELFETTPAPDEKLLNALVDDERLKTLWQQIDALHEVLIQQVEGDRSTTDVYQQELLLASSLLLQSRANYDDARAIVNRVRADLNRQRRVNADIMRYRPLLLNYYLGWVIALGVLALLKDLFGGVAEAVGVAIVAAAYYPMLAGVLGALISGFITLDRHTTKLRDFDPIHISWYLLNPLLGGVMGLLMFLLAAIANEDLLQDAATGVETAITWLLCVVAGMNQHTVLRQLNDLLKRFGARQR